MVQTLTQVTQTETLELSKLKDSISNNQSPTANKGLLFPHHLRKLYNGDHLAFGAAPTSTKTTTDGGYQSKRNELVGLNDGRPF